MRLIIRIILLSALPLFCKAQPEPYNQKIVDSIKLLLPTLKDERDKVKCLNILSAMFTTIDSRLGLQYAEEAITLSRKINYTDGLLASLGHSAFINAVSTEWPRSINELKEIMQYIEEDDERMLFVYNVMFINYVTKGEIEQGLAWGRKALNHPLFSKMNEINRWATYMQMGIVFQSMNKLDSAKKYAQLLKELVRKYESVSPDLAFNSYTLFAMIALHDGRHDEALKNYRLATNHIGLAEVYDITGHKDSVIYYAKLGLARAQSQQSEGDIQRAALLLAKHYETSSPAEANKYLRMYIASRDKKFNIDKLKQFEQIRLDEQRSGFELEKKLTAQKNRVFFIALASVLAITLAFILLLYRNIKQKQKANQALEKTLSDLKSAQAQLIQSEKMASLGELTAGIAHEIQNPLNFVNNFSDVNKELLSEMKDEMDKGNLDDAKALANDVIQNEEKINQHGKRADAIVKGMLQHSRTSSGVKEPTDVNALCDEYLRLAYHGLRAKDKNFNAKFETAFDNSIGKIHITPQDIGRVILNLINNAFYAVSEKQKQNIAGYEPTVVISSKKVEGKVEIKVKDNGTGIPQKIVDKIFQPFFTTKPTGQGTGLGLSLAYDIITKGHGGEIKLATKESEGSEFIILLPLINSI
jgi:two-component system, NtrC family, sensor kinase